MTTKPGILIYTDQLLPASETFIPGPAEMLSNYTPYYIGAYRVPGLPLPPERTIVANGSGFMGKMRQYAHLLFTGKNNTASLAQRLRTLNPQLILAHYGASGANALPLARALDIPLIVYFHGKDATQTEDFAQRSFYHRQYLRLRDTLKQEATLFLTTSDFIRYRLLQQGFPPQKVVTQYIGVRPSTAPLNPLSAREPIVLFVGRLVEKKGASYLIQAMQKVQAQMPEAQLVVVGEGPLRSRLEALAAQTLTNYRFVGWQTPTQVMHWMTRARIFSVPSVTAASGDSEGLGMVFLEAQSVGLPVVSFAHGGIPEAVMHGETGFLAPERNSEILAQHILTLLTQDELWQRLAARGQAYVQQHFNIEHCVAKLEQHCQRAFSEHEHKFKLARSAMSPAGKSVRSSV